MELGREYSTESLSDTQRAMLEDLRDYGLIWQRKASSRRFSPTRLATTLTSSLPPLPTATNTGGAKDQGFTVLETNYRFMHIPIISYLTTYAHPQMRKNKPLLPVTVQDQIRLWELERNRIKTQEGFLGLYTAFASQADYEYVLNYARKLDVVLWENPEKRCFFWQRGGPCEYSWIY
ncbi:transcription factor Tfb2-domain-containing protein [Russula aff. rugulosa BPL654]|nr:transcription factor Tfb2-domain-containing protein [Russula aff. rugulosa BPL654]